MLPPTSACLRLPDDSYISFASHLFVSVLFSIFDRPTYYASSSRVAIQDSDGSIWWPSLIDMSAWLETQSKHF
ncbi:hypothetical protein BDW66DRAFT_140236 [Aspergillus desertorum]